MKFIVISPFGMGGVKHIVGEELELEKEKADTLLPYGYIKPAISNSSADSIDKGLQNPDMNKMVGKPPKKKGRKKV